MSNDVYSMPSAKAVVGAADDVEKAAQQFRNQSRAPSSNPWAEQRTAWDGSIQQNFTGPMAGANQSLTAQALREMGSPMDFGQFNVGTGDAHRQAAIQAASGQMGDWFSGMQGDLNAGTKQNLLNQGYAEGSPEFAQAMARDTGWAKDMGSTLDNAAIGLGTQGGAMRQSQDMATQQQRLSEALRQRSMPMDQLESMRGLIQGSGPRQADDTIFQGSIMDAEQKYNDYMQAKARKEQADQDSADSAFGVLGAGMSVVPVVGSLANAGMNALRGKKG